jgi:hypothetical protein
LLFFQNGLREVETLPLQGVFGFTHIAMLVLATPERRR